MPDLSKFNLSNELKTTFEIGDLIPFSWQDVVPGDHFKQSLVSLIRTQPLTSPVMDRLRFFSRFYYVPYRILMRNFEKMLMRPDDPLVAPTVYDIEKRLNQHIDSLNYDGILKDYNLLRAFGISSSDGNLSVDAMKLLSAFPFYAYQIIYNYFYKDPVLDDSFRDDFDPDTDYDFKNLFQIRKARLFNDYFTTTVPNTQYGSAVSLDMDGNSDIKVNEMRLAERLQVYKEKLLLHGARYIDYLKTFFGTSPNSEVLQQPILLGSGVSNINISDVDQMAPAQGSPLANTAGKSVSVVGDNGYQYQFKEHGIVLGLCFILPDQNYIAGIPRQFIKRDFYSFFNPQFSNIGLQETYGCELSAERKDTFGYNERYAELKYPVNVVAGDFKETLTHWHFSTTLGQSNLNNEFKLARTRNNPFAVRDYEFSYETKGDLSFYTAVNPTDQDAVLFLGKSGATLSSAGFYSIVTEFPLSKYEPIIKDDLDGLHITFYEKDYLPFMASAHGDISVAKYGYPLISYLYKNGTPNEDEPDSWNINYDRARVLAHKFHNANVTTDGYGIEIDAPHNPNMVMIRFQLDVTSLSSSPSNPHIAQGGLIHKAGVHLHPRQHKDLTFDMSEHGVGITEKRVIYNHILAVFRNEITALRPLPKNDRILI